MQTPQNVLVGETDGSDITTLKNPMVLSYATVQVPSKIHGKPPEQVTQFRFFALPCSEIFVNEITYWGTVGTHDPVYVTYYKILEAKKKNDESPLMITQ